MLELRNPHSILAVLDVRPRAVKSVNLSSVSTGTVWESIATRAAEYDVPVVVGGALRGRSGGRRDTERDGSGSASVEPPSPVPLEMLWHADTVGPPGMANDEASRDCFGLWLALDQVQDPQNLGAIFRLAGFFGVRGIVLTKHNSAPVNATVCDVATGGAEYVPFAVVANLAQAIDSARHNELWVAGTCERADASIRDLKRDRHWLLIAGNEGTGMRRLTREKCDQLVSFPPLGPIPSLNVATATAACLAVLTGGVQ